MHFIKADKIFDGKQFLPGNAVLAMNSDSSLQAVISDEEADAGAVERLEGILTPGFVNSHCHLELSHLKGLIPQHTGLPGFARQVIGLRNTLSAEERAGHMEEADRDMRKNGIVAVGDISNSSESFRTKAHSSIFYHTFIELIGLDPAKAGPVFEKGLALKETLSSYGLSGSLAPHAPYSTSRALIQKIAVYDEAQLAPLSIHNQESEEETRFFMGEPSGFMELYRSLGLDLSWFRPPGHSSLREYASVLPATPSLLVHNTVTRSRDLELVDSANTFWCFCPGANLYIESRLPDFGLFEKLNDRICIGTDSLASNGQLDVLMEAELIRQAAPGFSVAALLRALTFNGAQALGISDRFGQLLPGKNAGLNLLNEDAAGLQLIKTIT